MSATPLPPRYTSMLQELNIQDQLTLDALFARLRDRGGPSWIHRFDTHIHNGNPNGAYQMLFESAESAQISHAMLHSVSAEWLNTVTALIPPNGSVLDVGCGSAPQALYIAMTRPDVRVYGFDQSTHAIERARERAVALKLPNARFFAHTATSDLPQSILAEAGGAFDVVLSHCVLHELCQMNEREEPSDWHERLDADADDPDAVKALVHEAHQAAMEGRSPYAAEIAQHLARLSAWSRQYVLTLERLPSVVTSALYATAALKQGLEVQWGQSCKIVMRHYGIEEDERMPLWVMRQGAGQVEREAYVRAIYEMYERV